MRSQDGQQAAFPVLHFASPELQSPETIAAPGLSAGKPDRNCFQSGCLHRLSRAEARGCELPFVLRRRSPFVLTVIPCGTAAAHKAAGTALSGSADTIGIAAHRLRCGPADDLENRFPMPSASSGHVPKRVTVGRSSRLTGSRSLSSRLAFAAPACRSRVGISVRLRASRSCVSAVCLAAHGKPACGGPGNILCCLERDA